MAPTLVYSFGFTAFAVSTFSWLAGYRRTIQAPLNGTMTALFLWVLLAVLAFLGLTPEVNFGFSSRAPINAEAVSFLTKLVLCAAAAALIGAGAWVGSLCGQTVRNGLSVAICSSLGACAMGLVGLLLIR